MSVRDTSEGVGGMGSTVLSSYFAQGMGNRGGEKIFFALCIGCAFMCAATMEALEFSMAAFGRHELTARFRTPAFDLGESHSGA